MQGGSILLRALVLFLGLLPLAAFSNPMLAVRGRPHIDTTLGYPVLLTDQDTLLRGVSLRWDGGAPFGSLAKVIPSQTALHALATEYGLNTVHVYLEGDSSSNTNTPGLNATACDLLVQRTENAGLYLIITLGSNEDTGTIHSLPWSIDFWRFYASRYKERTHVLYEAHNEPVRFNLESWQDSDWDDQWQLYKEIRQAAPNTFILLGSFMGFAGDPNYGANYLKARGVNWANAGFAYHGYESRSGIEQAIALAQASPSVPTLLCTEFWPGDTAGQGYNSLFERLFNGWMQYQWLSAANTDLLDFQSRITSAGTVWTPDNPDCNWPARGTPGIPPNGSKIGLFSRGIGRFVGINPTNSGRLQAYQEHFAGTQQDTFIVERASPRRVRLKTIDGRYIQASGPADPLAPSSAPTVPKDQFEWHSLANGDFALRAYGGGGHLVTVNRTTASLQPNTDNAHLATTSFQINDHPDATPPTLWGAPYRGEPFELPGVVPAEDFDWGGEGVAYHDLTSANTGGRYRMTEGVDIQRCSDGDNCLASIESGEWTQYTVNVANGGGEFNLITHAASPNSGGIFHVEFNGIDATGPITVPNSGGWQTWTNLTNSVSLHPGLQIMRFWKDSGPNFNVRGFTFTSTNGISNEIRRKKDAPFYVIRDPRFASDMPIRRGRVLFEGPHTNTSWSPLGTNTVTGVPYYLSDPNWNNPTPQFYRFRTP